MSDYDERLRLERLPDDRLRDALRTVVRERDACKAQVDALREAIGNDDDVEAYIRALQWPPGFTDHDRTLVAGNIRAFHGWIKNRAGGTE